MAPPGGLTPTRKNYSVCVKDSLKAQACNFTLRKQSYPFYFLFQGLFVRLLELHNKNKHNDLVVSSTPREGCRRWGGDTVGPSPRHFTGVYPNASGRKESVGSVRPQQQLVTPEMRAACFLPALCLSLLQVGAPPGAAARYTADWASLDARPLPPWFDEAKVGIFVHWGVFSVPGFGRFSEWFWCWWKQKRAAEVDFMKKYYPPGFEYADFAHEFHAEFFDADNWAEIFKASGARYGCFSSGSINVYKPVLLPSWFVRSVTPAAGVTHYYFAVHLKKKNSISLSSSF